MKTFEQITKETVLKSENNTHNYKIFRADQQFSNHTVHLLLNIFKYKINYDISLHLPLLHLKY